MTTTQSTTPESFPVDPTLEPRHRAAEAAVRSFGYKKPDGVKAGKGNINLGKVGLIRGQVQVVKKDGGENNLHYHTAGDSMWMVLKGRARFYGPDDAVIGEYGPGEGNFMPAYARYWFENCGDEELEILRVTAMESRDAGAGTGRVDAAPQRFQVGSSEKFDAGKH